MKVAIEDINSAEVENTCRSAGIGEIDYIGKYFHPDHPSSNDWSITLYELPWGDRVASTNGDPIWEERDMALFGDLLAEYGIF